MYSIYSESHGGGVDYTDLWRNNNVTHNIASMWLLDISFTLCFDMLSCMYVLERKRNKNICPAIPFLQINSLHEIMPQEHFCWSKGYTADSITGIEKHNKHKIYINQ